MQLCLFEAPSQKSEVGAEIGYVFLAAGVLSAYKD